MGNEFTFYDYFDADGTQTNVIYDWLSSDAKQAKAYFNRMIGYLEASPPAGSEDTFWCFPYTWPLEKPWNDFVEIRKKVKGVQYRLICKVDGRDVFILTWGFHKGNWKTDITPQTAKDRVTKMKNNPKNYRREHDYS
jgi:hypothetical protein